MKNFKRVIAFMAAAMLVGSLAACQSSSSSEEQTEADTQTESEEANDADAAGSDKIVFGTNAEFAPFEYVTSEGIIGEFDGIDIAIAKEIGDALGKTVEINNMEFDSLLVALEQGQVDAVIAGMTVTEERKDAVDFSETYYEATQVMIVPEDSEITKAADMEGKNIAVIQGYTGQIAVEELGYEYDAFKNGADAVLELKNGKADVVVIDSATAAKYVSDNEGLKIVEDEEAFAGEEYAIAVKKGNTELLDQINSVITELLKDGTIAELGDKYSVAED